MKHTVLFLLTLILVLYQIDIPLLAPSMAFFSRSHVTERMTHTIPVVTQQPIYSNRWHIPAFCIKRMMLVEPFYAIRGDHTKTTGFFRIKRGQTLNNTSELCILEASLSCRRINT